MKVLLYLLLAAVVALVSFLLWFFFVFMKVPELNVPEDASPETRATLVDAYLTKLQSKGKFNGAVLIAEDGQPWLLNTYGFTDHQLATPLDERSAFRLASVSKQFTAATVLRAQTLGLLDIDRPLTDYLELPYEGVTLRHLLNHTSGIPDVYMELADNHREAFGEVLSISDVVKLLREHAPAKTDEPGAAFAYSNTGYVLLAASIEAVADTSFEAFFREQLSDPLGLTCTRVWNLLSDEATFPGKTASFSLFAGQAKPLPPAFLDGVAGDGGFFACPSDFLTWDQFWAGGHDLVPDSLLRQAFQPPTLNDGTASDYGFGWVVTPDGHWHNGAWLGARTFIARFPEQRRLVVLLDNSLNLRLDDIVKQVGKVVRPTEAGK